MAEPLLETRDLVKRFGGVTATDHLSIAVEPGELHALIGPNGAGKTTLIAQLSGIARPTSGTVRFEGHDITRLPPWDRALMGLARSFQVTSICRTFTALENVMLAVQARSGHSFRFWKAAASDDALRGPARAALDEVGLGARAAVKAGVLAHGEQRQLELAMALAIAPKLLLLDEPMAGLDRAASADMTALIGRLKARYTILLVEHDMDAVFALADRVTVLVYGRAIATGDPARIRSDPAVQSAYLGEESA
ncbi:MAG TPA: ABC transporter ATP-binding protein [Hyphomicrobiales bacterium]|nr:ABC transporter ATP-binding protein [Hyphomicrobiales bacterium]